MKMRSLFSTLTSLLVAGAVAAPAAQTSKLDPDVQDAIRLFQKANPKLLSLFDTSYGYAVFPSVGKGAVGIGAASGRGQVFEKKSLIGEAEMTQVTLGPQLGGQLYIEVIFFDSANALQEFKAGKTTMAAALSAVAAADRVAADAKYQQGVLVYTMAKSGLMFEASVGGQHFKFTSINAAPQTTKATEKSQSSPIEPTPQPVEVP